MNWFYAAMFALRLLYWTFVCIAGCGHEIKTQRGKYPPGWSYLPNRGGWLCPECNGAIE